MDKKDGPMKTILYMDESQTNESSLFDEFMIRTAGCGEESGLSIELVALPEKRRGGSGMRKRKNRRERE
jgi:hypothetical protein